MSTDDRATTWARFAQHVNPGKVATYERYGFDVTMGRREGARFWDRWSDRSWLNLHCNGGVFNLGHRNPRVVAAVADALGTVDIGNHHLVSPLRAELARRLAATTGGRLEGVVFGVSGGEANDLAIKVARAHTGRAGIVSATGGYHGHTGLALAAGDPAYRAWSGPNLPGFEQVPFDDLSAMDAAIGNDTAAVILEPIPATLGMPIASEGYLRGVQELCHDRGALFIADEVQTGLGRTGRMWCHQHDDLAPDLVVTGKGLSGGIVPITATLMRAELLALFEEHPFVHISTYGGSELGCVAALEVLDIVEEPGFLERVVELGERFAEALAPMPLELRRCGLMMGLVFPVPDGAMFASRLLLDHGLFTVYAGNDTSVLQLLPPLVLCDEELEQVVATLRGIWG